MNTPIAMLSSPMDLAALLLLALLLFGAKRLPEIARSLGTGMREFKDSVSGLTDDHVAPNEIAPATAAVPTPVQNVEPVAAAATDESPPAPAAAAADDAANID